MRAEDISVVQHSSQILTSFPKMICEMFDGDIVIWQRMDIFFFSCSKDNTLQYQYGQRSEHFFNLDAFRFTESFSDIYVHCKLTICRKDDDESRCAKGCQPTKRRKRSAEEDFGASLYIGPLKPKVVENDAGE